MYTISEEAEGTKMDFLTFISLLSGIIGIISFFIQLLIDQERISTVLPKLIKSPRGKATIKLIAYLSITIAIFGLIIFPLTKVVEWIPTSTNIENLASNETDAKIQLRQQPGSTKFTKTTVLSSDIFPTYITMRLEPNRKTVFAGTYGGGIYISQRANEWKLFGLEDQTITKIIAHENPNEGIFVSTNLGIFVTFDDGESWEARWPLTDLVTDIVSDPTDYKKIIAGTLNGIYFSNDGGQTWVSTNLQGEVVTSINRADSNSTVLYASCLFGSIYKSEDDGFSWEQIRKADDEGSAPIGVDPNDEETVYIGPSTLGLYKTTNSGATWEYVGLNGISISSILISPVSETIFVGSDDGKGLFTSDDGGKTWKNRGTLNDDIFSIAEDLSSPRNIIVATRNNGILSSLDQGITWSYVGLGGLRFERNFSIQSLSIFEDDPHHLLAVASFEKGIFESKDGGISWSPLPGNSDLLSNFLATFYIDPNNSKHYLASAFGGDVFESYDQGESWVSITVNLPRQGFAPVVAFEDGTIFAGPGTFGVWKKSTSDQIWHQIGLGGRSIDKLWADKESQRVYAFDNAGILHYSFDEGNTWVDDKNEFFSLAIDPSNFNNIVAVSNSYEVLVSNDGGLTWEITEKLSTTAQYAKPIVAASMSNPGFFYLSSELYLYVSKDAGMTWQQSTLPEYGYLGASYNHTLYFIGNQSLQRSDDDGLSWNSVKYKYAVSSGGKTIQISENTYLAGSAKDGIFVSQDSGETWQQTSIGAGYKVFGLTQTKQQNPVIVAVVESPFSELLVAQSNDGKIWTLDETDCNSRNENDYFQEIVEGVGKLWLVECSNPNTLLIINPQDKSKNISVDIAKIKSISDAFYTEDGTFFILSTSYSSADIWETSDLGQHWKNLGPLNRYVLWSLSNDRRSEGFLIGRIDKSAIGTFSPQPVVPFSSYSALLLSGIIVIFISLKPELGSKSWNDIRNGVSWLVFSPHTKTNDISKFTIIGILPSLALLNLVFLQIFPQSEYLWNVIAAQDYDNVIISIAQLLTRIPVTLFTQTGYVFASTTLLFIFLIFVVTYLMDVSAKIIYLGKREIPNVSYWGNAFAKGLLILILGNFGISILGIILAIVPSNQGTILGLSSEKILNFFSFIIFYKIIAVCLNSIADHSNVNYKKLAVIYMFLIFFVSILMAFMMATWIILLAPPEQTPRLEALPIVVFGLINIPIVIVYLTLNQVRKNLQ